MTISSHTRQFDLVSGNITIDQSTFIDSSISINLGNDHSAKITNSIFDSAPGGGSLYLTDLLNVNNTGGGLVANNTFVGTTISCNGNAMLHKSRFLESNIFMNTTGLRVVSGCFYHNNLLQPSQDLGGEGNITGPPMFVDPANGDFHLSPGSPAIDAAAPFPREPNTHDHDGSPRPQGRRSDIGAFEYKP